MTAPPPRDRFDAFLLTLGKLNYCWSNTESLLIHLIAGLARCDKETAVVIFLTLNTSRARIDLVERLAKLDRTGEDERGTVLSLTREMLRLAALRNRYNHCIYAFDPDGNAHSILMRISDRRDAIKMGQMNALDEEALTEIENSIVGLTELNGRIWRAARKFGFPL